MTGSNDALYKIQELLKGKGRTLGIVKKLTIVVNSCYVMFGKRAGVPYRIKHEATPEYFSPDNARTVSFLNDFKNEPLNTRIREGSLKINVF